jgi:hypothetical protein
MTKFSGNDIIDSRDIITRLEELREAFANPTDAQLAITFDCDESERAEWEKLEAFAAECDHVSDWEHGACFVHEDHFEDYIAQLIDDCYEIPVLSEWPYRHLTLDIAAAAREARQDYEEYTLDGEVYLVHT